MRGRPAPGRPSRPGRQDDPNGAAGHSYPDDADPLGDRGPRIGRKSPQTTQGVLCTRKPGKGSRSIAHFRYQLTAVTYPYDGLHPALPVGYRYQPCRSNRVSCPPLGAVPRSPTRQGSTCPRLTPSGERPPSCPSGAT
ncbi:hypothetical protein FRAAL0643 [Frankia alni ACN14a]|uniref:Uncharacterized protein n=1 Tax=Frankia alni (strain DSM 45986 / CECT 9034 / ACN14a) TaxID=326424 RepID=Q0RSY7_FRAAA|nr:hypothetical protein FRAAL0643 [Frankia alni ACN14a]